MTDHRRTIFLNDAEILDHEAFPGNQHILRVRAPEAARAAVAGSFAHVDCGGTRALRRPLSIMRADAREGWLEFLYKPVGPGLARLAALAAGERVSVLAPIGNGFTLDRSRPRVLALGGGVGIPPMVFLAATLREQAHYRPIVLMGSEVPFPFALVESRLEADVAAAGATHGLELLETWGIASRLTSNAALAGSFAGHVPDLARRLLEASTPEARAATQMVACGPEPMLAAVAALAAEFVLPCQLAVEEFMACGVGGCAGCTIRVRSADGSEAMKRVCVDGPVFEAAAIYPSGQPAGRLRD
jgi:dihydroorotate dehydrogenase electron transfer subunit